ncbi:putative alpha/beta superfamily hydrolase [Fontibacillus solani]|uniref:Putative alpha/beta superfamily hydrolase n=1 Tax=Fontibacillus solani TaxID=1572857 RepID=A0A7W3XS76_9BACL|nr:alpha/beta hydrolase-fold protein [Fontibacillus solani]MBA9086298.1 putative alpha/beta superfamily hydrolase [Fontibacillus solani]
MKTFWRKGSRIFLLNMLLIATFLLSACQNNSIQNEEGKSVEAQPAVVEGEDDKEDVVQTLASKGTIQLDEFEGRTIYIYLPANYQNSDKRYPVVYMHDGQNVFDASTSGYGKEWQVDEVLDKLGLEHTMKEVIVAAVAHGEADRALEYVPFTDPMIPSDGLIAEEFTKYFIDQIIPYVDSKYRTIPDRDNRMIMGSSFGGIQAFWMGYHHPEIFSAIGAVSPSTWVDNHRIFREMEKTTTEHPDVRIWLDMGGTEGMKIDPLVDTLIAQGFKYGEDLFFLMDKEGEHDELSWSKRVHNPLLMFGGDDPKQAVSLEVNDYMTSSLVGDGLTRINPVVTMDNGMSYTVSQLATYKVMNPENGQVDSKGNVTFLKTERIDVEVSYMGITKLHTIEYGGY